jgi:SNF2 family DNA or RNA helicase
LQGETKRVYQELAEDAAADLGDTSIFAPHILQRIIRLQQLVCSGELLDSENNAITFDIKPREALLRQLNEELGTQPYVIFTRFKRDVDIVRSILNEDVALLTGDEDTHQQWRDGKYRVLVANVASGSAAVRLERAQHVVFWSVGYSAIDYLQARGRINRDGQKARKIFFHHIVTSDTIDEQIYVALKTKLEASKAMDARL